MFEHMHCPFLEEINTFIQRGCIRLIKNDNKSKYNVTKYFYV